jgi:cysteine synthase A
MIQKLKSISHLIGNTPMHRLALPEINANVYAKLEYFNFSASVKARPAYYILSKAIEEGVVNEDTVIVESSSGNFAIALAMMCKLLGLQFIPVIDPNINPGYEKVLRYLCKKVVMVDKVDKTGGYLLTRIAVVNEIISTGVNYFWPNQYANTDNAMAYYNSLGLELCNDLESLDYVFVSVSSCGTIVGISKRLKQHFPRARIIAVDIEGSVIFSSPPKKRFISGLGSSLVSPLLKDAIIDEVYHLSHAQIIAGCNDLVNDHMIFAGASSGAAYKCMQNYLADKHSEGRLPNAVFICADRGDAYLDTIYNTQWVNKTTSIINEASALIL